MFPKKQSECVPCIMGLFLTAVLAPTATGRASEHWTTMEPRERFEKILWLRHGPHNPRQDDDTTELVKHLIDNPDMYCSFVDQILHMPDDPLELTDFEIREPLRRALGMAELLGSEHCNVVVVRFFDEVLQSYKSLTPTPATPHDDAAMLKVRVKGECDYMLISTLKILQEFNDPLAIDTCMAMIESFQPAKGEAGKVFVMLEYMAKVAPHRPSCRTELDRMYHDRKSRLYHNPQLKKVIDAIDAEDTSQNTNEHQP